jgi:hypothetical protein
MRDHLTRPQVVDHLSDPDRTGSDTAIDGESEVRLFGQLLLTGGHNALDVSTRVVINVQPRFRYHDGDLGVSKPVKASVGR